MGEHAAERKIMQSADMEIVVSMRKGRKQRNVPKFDRLQAKTQEGDAGGNGDQSKQSAGYPVLLFFRKRGGILCFFRDEPQCFIGKHDDRIETEKAKNAGIRPGFMHIAEAQIRQAQAKQPGQG